MDYWDAIYEKIIHLFIYDLLLYLLFLFSMLYMEGRGRLYAQPAVLGQQHIGSIQKMCLHVQELEWIARFENPRLAHFNEEDHVKRSIVAWYAEMGAEPRS